MGKFESKGREKLKEMLKGTQEKLNELRGLGIGSPEHEKRKEEIIKKLDEVMNNPDDF